MTISVGVFTVAENHPALPGHFPGNPIVPGVVLLDELSALLSAEERPAGFPTVRFNRPVRPGQRVEVFSAAGHFTCRVDGAEVLSGTVAFP